MTEVQEARLRENGYFLYQGCHFKPVRQFTEMDGDFLKRQGGLGVMMNWA